MLSASRIVGLLRLKINAPEWVEAVNILRDCLNSERGKQYLRCSVRPSRQKEFKMIRLEVPDCWPEE